MLFSASPLSPLDRDPGNNHRPTTREPRQPPDPRGKRNRPRGNQGGAAGVWEVGGGSTWKAWLAEGNKERAYMLAPACFPFMGFMLPRFLVYPTPPPTPP